MTKGLMENMDGMGEVVPIRNEACAPKIILDDDLEVKTIVLEAIRLIREIDFPTLEEIFIEEQRKSQVDPIGLPIEVINFSAKKHPRGFVADATPAQKRMRFFMPDGDNHEDLKSRADFISAIFHESTHLASGSMHGEPGVDGVTDFHTGLEHKIVTQNEDGWELQTFFSFLNESVTDILAERIFDEYVMRTGDKVRLDEGQGYQRSYEGSRFFIQTFCELAASSLDVAPDVVWDGLKQGYFSGLDMREGELVKELREVLGDELFAVFLAAVERLDKNDFMMKLAARTSRAS